MDLNLFNNRKINNDIPNKNNDLINTFIEELKNALKRWRSCSHSPQAQAGAC